MKITPGMLPEIAIPTRGRADNQLTLEWLLAHDYPKGRISLFVHREEAEEHERWTRWTKGIVAHDAEGMGAIRQAILDHFAVDDQILMLDDDTRRFCTMDAERTSVYSLSQRLRRRASSVRRCGASRLRRTPST